VTYPGEGGVDSTLKCKKRRAMLVKGVVDDVPIAVILDQPFSVPNGAASAFSHGEKHLHAVGNLDKRDPKWPLPR